MFTYVKAKNFKSLKNIYLNLKSTKTKVNNFVVIYGENGSGKTNIVELFRLLQQNILMRYIDKVIPIENIKKDQELSNNIISELMIYDSQVYHTYKGSNFSIFILVIFPNNYHHLLKTFYHLFC